MWVAEAWGQDAVSVLGHLTAVTERIGLGSALMQIPARTPAATAMAAVTLDVLSEGRFRLGLGVSGPQVSEGWHGVPFRRPMARTREYVEIVRQALAREGPLEYRGEEFQLPLEGSELGKPLKLLAKPVQERIPIYLGAIGPKSVEQTARIADGWIPFMFTTERAQDMLAPFAGTDVDVAPAVLVCLDETPSARWTSPARGSRSISAAWGRRTRTSTWRRPSASGTATPRARCSGCSRRATGWARPGRSLPS